MIYVANAFSLSMVNLPEDVATPVNVVKLSEEYALADIRDLLRGREYVSCVGHASTAAVLSGLLGMDIPMNRASIKLAPGDLLVVAQYRGPRLEEGAVSLPEGASFDWYTVQ